MKATFRRVSTLRFLHPRRCRLAPGLDQIPSGRLVTPAPTLIGCELLKSWPAPNAPRKCWGTEISRKEARLYNILRTGQHPFRERRRGGEVLHTARRSVRAAVGAPAPPLLKCPGHRGSGTCPRPRRGSGAPPNGPARAPLRPHRQTGRDRRRRDGAPDGHGAARAGSRTTRITWLCGKTAAPLVACVDGIDECIVVDDAAVLSGNPARKAQAVMSGWSALRGRRFDLVDHRAFGSALSDARRARARR